MEKQITLNYCIVYNTLNTLAHLQNVYNSQAKSDKVNLYITEREDKGLEN